MRLTRAEKLFRKHYPKRVDAVSVCTLLKKLWPAQSIDDMAHGNLRVKPEWARVAQYWGWITLAQYERAPDEAVIRPQMGLFTMLIRMDRTPEQLEELRAWKAWQKLQRRWPLREPKSKRMSRHKAKRYEREARRYREERRQDMALARKFGLDIDDVRRAREDA